ncbi:phosphatase PAP2 family protein [Aeromicrobium sp.]|uniref:phosphatase PAP2 family protein n=1 Tax=Aeromicrobium sp. TaxID=1871063 RepID=UPI0019C96900|nr:phosphatase PAP2 family protein [Aeromicrobium sp.]MBC7631698.1 phosphatase PAP2 family protein [Aeromicrobium sp.]
MTLSTIGRTPLRYTIAIIIAVVAVAVGVLAPRLAGASPKNLSAVDRVSANPPPTLFTDAQIASIAVPIERQDATASSLMKGWFTSHGAVRDDAAFVAWVETQVPAPPAAAARASELKKVQGLAATRTPAGTAAATWLEVNGKKDIWKVYLHDQRELQDTKTGNAEKAQLKAMVKMAKTTSDDLAAKYRQSAPYVLDPSLRTDHVVKKGTVCPCSYPSRHAARSAAAAAYLGTLSPHRRSDYVWMRDQVAFSRVYMAGHVESDITAGTLLGDMIADYFLVTSGVQPVSAPR